MIRSGVIAASSSLCAAIDREKRNFPIAFGF
jgi:hypothetical protein